MWRDSCKAEEDLGGDLTGAKVRPWGDHVGQTSGSYGTMWGRRVVTWSQLWTIRGSQGAAKDHFGLPGAV